MAARLASRAPFFAFCLLLVIKWLVQGVALIVSKGSLHAFLDSQYQYLLEHLASRSPDPSMDRDMKELRAAIGLEAREGTSGNANQQVLANTRSSGD